MKYFSLAFLLSLYVFAPFQMEAQDSTSVDSAFAQKMDDAWSEVKQAFSNKKIDQDSLQKQYADEFFEYYLEHPNTKTGKNAISDAITMWGNTGSVENLNEVIQNIDYSSDLWTRILRSTSNAFHRREDKSWEDNFLPMLKELKTKITSPKGKSQALIQLGDHYLGKNQKEKAKSYYRQIISMDASTFYVTKAKGNVKEINTLGIGMKAPDFTAQSMEGNDISLSDMNDKVVLLAFWATWCGPCKPEIPHLKNLNDTFPEDQLQVIGIALDQQTDTLKKFIAEKKMDWPQIQQQEKWQGEIAQLYNANRIPRSFVINENREIVAKDLRGDDLENKVLTVINGKAQGEDEPK